MSANSDLHIGQMVLPAGTEATPPGEGWCLCRVCAGTGYVLIPGQAHPVEAGDVVVAAANQHLGLRASQLSLLRACHFSLSPQSLQGLLSLAEQLALERLAGKNPGCLRVIPRDQPAAHHFALICRLRATESDLVVRGEMLSLALRALSPDIGALARTSANQPSVTGKFHDLMLRLRETDLIARSATDLASDCGCSERHFRRLYREFFGTSLVQRQIELRIRVAKRLLQETDRKVIDVAWECGFHHLGLFNATFKRLAGLTPSDWRKAARNKRLMRRRNREISCPKDWSGPPRNGRPVEESNHPGSAAVASPGPRLKNP
jgi:AraC-like DNA-binding protein